MRGHNLSELNESRIEKMIYIIRGTKIMLDSDLTEFYGVETNALNRAVKRNIPRFPEDFMITTKFYELRVIRR